MKRLNRYRIISLSIGLLAVVGCEFQRARTIQQEPPMPVIEWWDGGCALMGAKPTPHVVIWSDGLLLRKSATGLECGNLSDSALKCLARQITNTGFLRMSEDYAFFGVDTGVECLSFDFRGRKKSLLYYGPLPVRPHNRSQTSSSAEIKAAAFSKMWLQITTAITAATSSVSFRPWKGGRELRYPAAPRSRTGTGK